jgi:hypothetical protein
MLLFPVAWVPYATRVGGLGRRGCCCTLSVLASSFCYVKPDSQKAQHRAGVVVVPYMATAPSAPAAARPAASPGPWLSSLSTIVVWGCARTRLMPARTKFALMQVQLSIGLAFSPARIYRKVRTLVANAGHQTRVTSEEGTTQRCLRSWAPSWRSWFTMSSPSYGFPPHSRFFCAHHTQHRHHHNPRSCLGLRVPRQSTSPVTSSAARWSISKPRKNAASPTRQSTSGASSCLASTPRPSSSAYHRHLLFVNHHDCHLPFVICYLLFAVCCLRFVNC